MRLERLPQSTANLAGCDKGFYLYPENSGKPLGHPKREVVWSYLCCEKILQLLAGEWFGVR